MQSLLQLPPKRHTSHHVKVVRILHHIVAARIVAIMMMTTMTHGTEMRMTQMKNTNTIIGNKKVYNNASGGNHIQQEEYSPARIGKNSFK